MKIVLVGKSGTIGSAVFQALNDAHEIVSVGRSSGDFNMDITDVESIRSTFDKVGPFDALICAAGDIAFNTFENLTSEDWEFSINTKMMGQINLVRESLSFLSEKGSITLISGLLTDLPIAAGTCASTINGAIDHFVKTVSTQLPKQIRINAVSPGLLEESVPAFGPYCPGLEPVSSKRVANAYVRSAIGVETGQVIKVS